MRVPIRYLLALALSLSPGVGFGFEPFFDDNPATRHAPEAPPLTDLDLDVLILCGGWGAPVEARDFEAMLLEREHRAALERIHAALGGRVFSGTDDLAEFVRQLRRAWFEQHGFKHIFCGEPGVGRDLGGFHYAPRYWQAQDEGWAGYRALARDAKRRPVAKCRKPYLRERVAPPVFNISIAFVNPEEPSNDVKCLGGYHYRMDAENMLIAATAAFKQANRRVGKNVTESCFYETRFDGIEPHYSNLVIRSRAIRTFYPLADSKPYCRKNRRDFTACLCSRL
ncbi:MAG: hypothetical protein DWQ08_06615 [Proteobacteria bacterium]|nr:MAG: hypothetical protein DWQ08_06615 [Pseudomonadota bacterium]